MKSQQRPSFELVLQQHKALIYKIAQLYTTNRANQEDLMQEIAIQLYHALPSYTGEAKISTWIYRIALNVAISYLRKEQTRAKITEPIIQFTLQELGQEDSTRNQQIQQLYSAISQLKELDKAIIILYLDGEPQAEIAAILGLTLSNVSTKIGRIKEQLKTITQQLNA